VLVCAHGGNAGPLRRALERLDAEGRSVSGWWPRWGGDLHAGRTETSLLLAVAPDRVRLADAAPGDTRTLDELLPLLEAGGVGAVSPTGVLGDPAGATADEGRALLAGAAAALGLHVAAVRSGATDGPPTATDGVGRRTIDETGEVHA